MRNASILTVLLFLLGSAPGANAQILPDPTGRVILVVDGDLASTNRPGSAWFDMAMLEAIGLSTFRTKTPFNVGEADYEGVPILQVLDFLGARNVSSVEAVGIDGYRRTIRLEDIKENDAHIVTRRNGARLSVRERGPLQIVMPDPDGDLLKRKPYLDGLMVWQLLKLIVK